LKVVGVFVRFSGRLASLYAISKINPQPPVILTSSNPAVVFLKMSFIPLTTQFKVASLAASN
jgi:competence transcription factor ComK